MVLLSHFPSLVVILSITLFTCNHMIVTIVSVFTTPYYITWTHNDWICLSKVSNMQYLPPLKEHHRVHLWLCNGHCFELHLPKPLRLTLCDHPAGNPLRLLRWDLQQLAGALQRDVVVELGGGQQVVLDHGVLQDRHPVRHHRLLVSLQQSLK